MRLWLQLQLLQLLLLVSLKVVLAHGTPIENTATAATSERCVSLRETLHSCVRVGQSGRGWLQRRCQTKHAIRGGQVLCVG
jgi:hypothetical protein